MESVGIEKAIPAKLAPTINCVSIIQYLLVLIKSMNGLQKGFITHGKYSQLVYNAISEFDISSFLYSTTETIITNA